jgi:hypothetical protein
LSFSSDLPTTSFTGATVETSIADSDLVLIYDDSATAVRKMTKANLVAGIGASAGQVIQVVSTTVSGTITLSLNNASADITGLSATITPSSASNKILILYKINYSNASGDSFVGNIVRGATNLFQGTAGTGLQGTISFHTANMNNYWSLEAGGSFLDSPNTTSATTYKIQAETNNNLTMYFNRTQRGGSDDPIVSSSITLMEIKG